MLSDQQPIMSVRLDPRSNPIVQEYVLPNFASHQTGRIRQPNEVLAETEQVLRMNSERFLLPEILFRPDDIGVPLFLLIPFEKNSLMFMIRRAETEWNCTCDCPHDLGASGRYPRDVLGAYWPDWR
jgi:hypothetical protein